MKNPIQPVIKDENGVLRFRGNAIVASLLQFATDKGMDMNEIAAMDFCDDDRRQFAQLIGYSLSGFSELDYVDDDTYDAATKMGEGMTEDQARISVLTDELNAVRVALREPMARLLGVHPDDLGGNIDE